MNTSDIVRDLCAKQGISVTELEKELGFGNGSLTKNNYMRSDRLLLLAKYFHVTMEYLMGEEALQEPSNENNDEFNWFAESYSKLSPNIQEAILLLLKSV